MNSPETTTYRCSAPAKLILSGEHAVLYNGPALSMAIQLYSHCECGFTQGNSLQISIELDDFQQSLTLNKQQYQTQSQAIEQRYRAFQNGELAINKVLNSPVELILCSFYLFAETHSLKNGIWSVNIHSEIPTGRGLGSSASVIISLLKTLYRQHGIEPTFSEQLSLAREIESRQHGRSSGLDPASILHGGIIKYRLQQPVEPIQTHPMQAWLIDSGAPLSSTGEAVSHVRQYAENQILWDNFANITDIITDALQQQNKEQLHQAIRENQLLLEQIGVVPKTVAGFIDKLNRTTHAAAKICGSGSVRGEAAGIILCFSEQAPSQLCANYGYAYQAITLDLQGAGCEL